MAVPSFQRATIAACLRPWHLRIFSSMSGGGGEVRRQLVLYSKPDCCLCDGLKEKLSVAFSLGGPHSLLSVDLQVRDIAMNPEWEQKYQYEISVLAKVVLPDGTEIVTIPEKGPCKQRTQNIQIDTKDIIFICGGAFVDLEKTISERRHDSLIGFGAPVRQNMRTGTLTNALVASSLLDSEVLPRLSPRLGVELIQKKISTACDQ